MNLYFLFLSISTFDLIGSQRRAGNVPALVNNDYVVKQVNN